jgi:hypothetical protein
MRAPYPLLSERFGIGRSFCIFTGSISNKQAAMYRCLFGSEGAYGTSPNDFSVSFPGAYLSLFRPKPFFFLSPSHIAAPPAKGLTNHIASGLPFVVPAPVTFVRSSFARASIATVVNSAGLIEEVPADTPRFDHDPITLASKGLLIEEARTHLIIRSNELTNDTA